MVGGERRDCHLNFVPKKHQAGPTPRERDIGPAFLVVVEFKKSRSQADYFLAAFFVAFFFGEAFGAAFFAAFFAAIIGSLIINALAT